MYRELLVTDRIRTSSRGSRTIVDEVESDRSRVLYSAAFRRLQRKTQVFPLEDNASVRTRLTHSLEVAHIGRFLASRIVILLRTQGLLNDFGLDADYQHAFSVTVEVACLLHDIGNPPFGHFGEFAIAKWFSSGARDWCELLDGLKSFDGNPQGFRIISKLSGADGETGMNLTLSQLASTIKYPSIPSEKQRFKKFGVFSSEQSVLSAIRSKFDLKAEQRFPLAYLMEAADDICYCLSDIEDGIEKGIILHKNFVQDLLEEAPDGGVTQLLQKAIAAAESASAVDHAVAFRSNLVTSLVNHAAETYVARHAEVLSGSIDELISSDSSEGKLLDLIKKVVRRQVYSDRSIESLELAGMAIITSLLDRFGALLDIARDDFAKLLEKGARVKGKDVEKRLVDFVANSHLSAYKAIEGQCTEDVELCHRAHMIVDYISGMTDPFALKMHQVLTGSRL